MHHQQLSPWRKYSENKSTKGDMVLLYTGCQQVPGAIYVCLSYLYIRDWSKSTTCTNLKSLSDVCMVMYPCTQYRLHTHPLPVHILHTINTRFLYTHSHTFLTSNIHINIFKNILRGATFSKYITQDLKLFQAIHWYRMHHKIWWRILSLRRWHKAFTPWVDISVSIIKLYHLRYMLHTSII